MELIFPADFQIECFLIPGLVYIAQGELKSKDVQLTVKKFTLPQPLPQLGQSLLDAKLKTVCDSISYSKSGLDFNE